MQEHELELAVGDVVQIGDYFLTILKVNESHVELSLNGPGATDDTIISLTSNELAFAAT